MNVPTTTCPNCDGDAHRDSGACPRCGGNGAVDLDTLGDAELEWIAADLLHNPHPLRAQAAEILHARQADDWARRTPAGGEA